jgi:AraC-like DNA-binding protein
MLADLKLSETYEGLIYLAEAKRNLPTLKSHRHAELELNLILDGAITYVISRKRYTFTRGALLWIFPTQEHQLVDRSSDASFYVAVFKPKLIKRACRGDRYNGLKSENAAGKGILSRRLSIGSYELLRKMMDSLMDDALDPDLLNREAGFGVRSNFRYRHHDPDTLNAGLRYLLTLAWRYYQAGSESERAVQLHPSVRKALTLLSKGESVNDLSRIASQCGLSNAYLSRLFRRQVGVPLTHYRNSVRLTRFMEYYTQSEQKTILESVFASGFGSYAQFYKVFVKNYGYGPGRYLRGK